MRNAQPTLGTGWMPLAAPPRPARSRVRSGLRRQFITLGVITLAALFTGILNSPRGPLAVISAWALVGLLGNHLSGNRFARVFTYAMVAVLVWAVGTAAPVAPQVKAPKLTAPVKVEDSQTDYLAQIREGAANLYQQIATGFSQPPAEAKKGGGG